MYRQLDIIGSRINDKQTKKQTKFDRRRKTTGKEMLARKIILGGKTTIAEKQLVRCIQAVSYTHLTLPTIYSV